MVDFNVTPIAEYYYNRGIYKFGSYVENRLEEVSSTTRSEAIARSNRLREFARLMGEDMSTSTVGFRDPATSPGTKHGKGSDSEDEEQVLRSGY